MARQEKRSFKKTDSWQKESLKHHLQDYCASTSIHGVKYLAETSTKLEKLWWAAILSCCMIGNGYLIHKVWIKWNNSPVIVSFAETAMPIWEVPFPAITICSEIKSQVDIFNFNAVYHSNETLSSDMRRKLEAVCLLCDNHVIVDDGQQFADNTTIDFLLETAPDMDGSSIICQFADGGLVNCSSLFTKIFTDEGVCFSFNMLSPSEMFRGYGWILALIPEDYPPILIGSGHLKYQISLQLGPIGGNNKPTCNDLQTGEISGEDGLSKFEFNREEKTANHYMNPTFQEHGIVSNWSLENGYTKDSPLGTYPQRVISAGASTSMNIVLKFETRDSDHFCRGPVLGFKVLLHNPGEFPLVKERYIRAPLEQEILAMVQPKIMTTSEGLRSYPANVRQCFFPSERYLAHFYIYTQRNCEVECLTNFTMLNCQCVGLHMPRNESTPLCGAASKSCMLEAERSLKVKEIAAARNEHITSKCNCLPACQSIQYDAETSQADFEASKTLNAYGDNSSEVDGMGITRVKIFFKDMQFTTSKRSELFGPVDFIANCGGLLGLFCGISLLSICELIYYITIRFWANFRAVKKKHETQEKEVEDGVDSRSNDVAKPS